MVNKVIIIVCSLILFLYVLSFFCFLATMSGIENKSLSEQPVFLKPFYSIALWLRQKFCTKSNTAQIQKKTRIKRQFQIINPSEPVDKQFSRFECERLSYILLCLFVGTAFCILLTGSKMLSPFLKEGNQLERAEYGMGKKEVDLVAKYEGVKEKKHLTVKERTYTNEEIEVFLRDAERDIPEIVSGENESLEHISGKLNLVRKIEGSPFDISWEMSDYQLVDLDGTVHNEQIDENAVVTLTATLSYLEEKYYLPIHIVIEPKIYSAEELLSMELSQLVEQGDSASANQKFFMLPNQLNQTNGGKEIRWEEMQSMDCLWVLLLTVLAAFAIYAAKGNDLQKKVKARENELAMDYSEMIHKLTLYMNAGMTIRNTFFKLKEDYIRRKKNQKVYLYEEIMMTCYELETGISEVDAYENFGKRCGLRQYVRLSALLNQNLKKGSTNLIVTLQQEAKDAFDARKNMARRLGEEAGTKILGPMILMLGVVLIMIMIPAYLSFSM